MRVLAYYTGVRALPNDFRHKWHLKHGIERIKCSIFRINLMPFFIVLFYFILIFQRSFRWMRFDWGKKYCIIFYFIFDIIGAKYNTYTLYLNSSLTFLIMAFHLWFLVHLIYCTYHLCSINTYTEPHNKKTAWIMGKETKSKSKSK